MIGTICASAVSAAVPAANARGTALPARRVQQLVTNYFVGPVGTVALHIIIMDTITNNTVQQLIFKKCRSLVTQSERFCRVVQPSRLHLRLTRVRNSLARHANLDTHGAFRVSEWSQS